MSFRAISLKRSHAPQHVNDNGVCRHTHKNQVCSTHNLGGQLAEEESEQPEAEIERLNEDDTKTALSTHTSEAEAAEELPGTFTLASGDSAEFSPTQGVADLAQTTGGKIAGLEGD